MPKYQLGETQFDSIEDARRFVAEKACADTVLPRTQVEAVLRSVGFDGLFERELRRQIPATVPQKESEGATPAKKKAAKKSAKK
jgi:hypothetical protein